MAKLILGVAGEMGSGKGTITKHVIQEHRGSSHRFSTMLRDVLDRMHIEQTRENMATLSTIVRKNFGEDLLAKAICHETQKDEHDVVIIDGVRRMDDIVYLRKLPHFKLIYVDADIRVRYERVVRRGENANDTSKTFDEFKRDHELESELQIKDLKNYADYAVDNNGTFVDLYKQIEDIIKENLK